MAWIDWMVRAQRQAGPRASGRGLAAGGRDSERTLLVMRVAALAIALALSASVFAQQAPVAPPVPPPAAPAPPAPESVRAIAPPETPLPADAQTAAVTRFAFIVYGDTRSGAAADPDVPYATHSRVVDRMLETIKARAGGDRAVRFVLQTGDAVLRGSDPHQWNAMFTPVIERITRDAGVPYFLTAGNHDVLPPRPPETVGGRQNLLRAVARLMPPVGSPRRYADSAAYAFAFGSAFVLAIDSNLAADSGQLAWAGELLGTLDRQRFPLVFAFMHHAPYSSGPHGGPNPIEPQTVAVRTSWMPLFRKHHVRLILAGHEHFYEQWIERYVDGGAQYRMDVFLTGGGGAPVYTYRGEPDLTQYLADGAAQRVRVEHLARPGDTVAENPNHFIVFDVDGSRISAEVIGIGDAPFAPYQGRTSTGLND
jgi:hypothetical protein